MVCEFTIVDQDYLVPRLTQVRENVLQRPDESEIGNLGAEFLLNFTHDCSGTRFPKLDATSKWSAETLVLHWIVCFVDQDATCAMKET